jgi:hypothetical protein
MHHADRVRVLVYTTIFGALWGVVETLLGTYLHLFNVPFKGAIMAAIGAIVLCAERLYTPCFGATLSTGFIAMVLKCFSAGTVRIWPVIGMGVETVLAELVFTALGAGRIGLFLAPVVCCMEGVPHMFVVQRLIYGEGVFDAYLKVAAKMQAAFGLREDLWVMVLLLWIAGHLAIGTAAGVCAIGIGAYLRRE